MLSSHDLFLFKIILPGSLQHSNQRFSNEHAHSLTTYTNLHINYYILTYRTSTGAPSDGIISPSVEKIDPEFQFIRLEDMEIVATLGMGGFGRVELVSRINYSDRFCMNTLVYVLLIIIESYHTYTSNLYRLNYVYSLVQHTCNCNCMHTQWSSSR